MDTNQTMMSVWNAFFASTPSKAETTTSASELISQLFQKMPTPIIPQSPSSLIIPKLIGGCYQCNQTFSSQLEMIHHAVNHYPQIFYSFQSPNQIIKINKKTPLLSNISPSHSKNDVFNMEKQSHFNKNNGSCSSNGVFSGKEQLSYDMCPHCCQTFLSKVEFESHLKDYHSPMQKSSPLLCSVRRKSVKGGKTLVSLPKLAAGSFAGDQFAQTRCCTKCNQLFLSVFDLNLHIGIHNGYSYDCKDCGRCFKSRKCLSIHNKSHRYRKAIMTSDKNDCKEQIARCGQSDKSQEMAPKSEMKETSTNIVNIPFTKKRELSGDELEGCESLIKDNFYLNSFKIDIKRRRYLRGDLRHSKKSFTENSSSRSLSNRFGAKNGFV
uniref:C2H2-type domain-containing protein n=1 Tax=Rhabditophanes sp. KR3021 TaxID=114890 RepID=A0AC35TXI6_9BILA